VSSVFTLREIVKDFLIPGSLLFLVLGQAIGLVLLFGTPRTARWGRRWITSLLCLYGVLSLQGTSDLLVFGLSHEFGRLWTADAAVGARIIVVLSNGVGGGRTDLQEMAVVNLQSAYNALESARLYRLLGDPIIVASGGVTDRLARAPESAALTAALSQLGVPEARIVQEKASLTTYQQVINVSAWLKARGDTRFVLVTTPEHMRRAVGAFATQGLRPIPSVSPLRYGGSPWWRPTRYALQGSENASYEYFAWCWYRIRGWVA
jgi:uncharacterized SAM-binding protein YcdF (DUF218 family)